MALQMTPGQYRRLVQGEGSDRADGIDRIDEVAGRNGRNRSEGEQLQARLDVYHEELRAADRAVVYRTNPDMRMVAPGRAIVTGKGPVDYVAFLATGRVVHFDAKSRAGDAFSVGAEMAHQLNWLGTMRAYGHWAGLLVWWKDHEQCRWHPVGSFEKRVRMRDGFTVVGVEWLATVEVVERIG